MSSGHQIELTDGVEQKKERIDYPCSYGGKADFEDVIEAFIVCVESDRPQKANQYQKIESEKDDHGEPAVSAGESGDGCRYGQEFAACDDCQHYKAYLRRFDRQMFFVN